MNRKEILIFLAIYGTVAGIGGIATAFSHDALPAPMAEAYSYSPDGEDFDALQDFAAAAREDQRAARDSQLAAAIAVLASDASGQAHPASFGAPGNLYSRPGAYSVSSALRMSAQRRISRFFL